MNIPPQAAFLYRGEWSPNCDSIFVACLIRFKGETHWTKTVFPSWFLLTVVAEIKDQAGVVFTERKLKDRVEILRSRYHTFKGVIRHGAVWDMPTKSLNAFAGAYYYHEEPIYSELACLFGMHDVKVESETELVVISDDTEELPCNDPSVDVIHLDEEVNSPAIFPRPNVCRKLFEYELNVTDRESTTTMGIHYIDQAPGCQMRTRAEKDRELPKPPLCYQERGGPSTRSPHGSSCCSNSSIGWRLHLKK
ncbi:hypothetical protein SASPL_129692 [Salvia splendens]|uniref:Myb/SANT-like domain-containing protein n=1 Tax=Salvia splendens TaxID=180675 RepID=A0A8X8XFG8_SALSN|nr:hypothetical protein SASPL_129692 [Salvia splendens]